MTLGASKYGAGTEGSALVDEHGEPLLHVVFVSPQIHWNTGNIGRTCLGLGARLHLVGPLGFSLDERQVRRAGLDYWSHVDVRVYADWAEFSRPGGALRSLGGARYFFTKFGAVPAAELEWTPEGAIVLLFGSEVDGFDSIRPWLDGCEEGRSEMRVAFPMVDERFRSFNLSTSASMALWDAYKSRTRLGSRPVSADLSVEGGIVGLQQS
jgi:tRNA (cytidine/uridine-2'-O-)-methyltransferase